MEFDYKNQPGKKLKKGTKKQGPALISIVTPYYNAGKYFEQTFRSVRNQTFPWFEWLIVDDGSDGQKDLAVLEEAAAQDERITVIRQKNGGLACARNTGFRKAGTDIIVPLDADDLLAPQYLEYTFFGLYFNPEAAWCYTDTVGFGQQEYLWRYPWNAARQKKKNYLTATAAIRRHAFEAVGGYKTEKGHYYEDWRFWLELLAAHKYPVHVKGYLFWYRRRSDGMLSGIKTDKLQKELGKRIIAKAAAKADSTVKAVEYPIERSGMPYHKPQPTESWESHKIISDDTKKRILMLVPWLVMGGADKYNLDLVSGLDRNRFEVSIITTVASENEWQSYFAEYTDEIFHLPDFLDPAHYAEYVSYYIRTREIDILFVSNSYRGYYMLPLLRKQFPKLCIVDYVHMEEWYWKAGGFARLSGIFASCLDKTYVCNNATRSVLISHFQKTPESVETLYVGVDEKRFDPHIVKRGALYHRLGVPENRPVILFPCRICPQKRPFLMLEIAQKLRRKKPEVLFAVIGDGIQRSELEKEICRRRLEKNVVCLGGLGNMERYYKDAKITLICSIREGLSITAYESCAMGTPVVSSDVGGQSDLIDSSCGILVQMRQNEEDIDNRNYSQEEVNDYVKALLKLLSDEAYYRRCSENCRKKIENTFTTKAMLERIGQELDMMAQDEGFAERRQKIADAIRHTGSLPEEIYMVEMAEEERRLGSSAIMEILERIVQTWLPVGSRRREKAVRIYRSLIKKI